MAAEMAWPDQFVYVCSAGRAAAVNWRPLCHAGLDRVRGVVVFCGASGLGSVTGDDRAEAIAPMETLVRGLSERTGGRLTGSAVKVLFGDPNEIGAWRRRMGEVFARFGAPEGAPLPIVFNIKGGMTEMKIGGIVGRTDEEQFLIVTVRGDQVERVSGSGQRAMANCGPPLTLADYLDIYDYKEDSRSEFGKSREALQAFYCREEARIRQFVAVMGRGPGTIVPHLNRMGQACFVPPHDRFEAKTFAKPPPVPDRVFNALAGLDGLVIERDRTGNPVGCRLETVTAADFFRGQWLEGLLYLDLATALKGRNDVELAANLSIMARDGRDRLAEFDVAIMLRGQLHVIEAKTGRMTSARKSEAADRAFTQLDSVKRTLLGQVGKALIVNPCITDAPVVGERARRGGEEVFLGPDAVAGAVARVKQLAEGAAEA